MKDTVKVSLKDKEVARIVRHCYPQYKGRKISLVSATSYHMSDYWDGGSRDYVRAYHIESGAIKDPAQHAHNPYGRSAHSTVEIPEGIAMVEHTIFQGKDMGIRIHVHPNNFAKLLPAAE